MMLEEPLVETRARFRGSSRARDVLSVTDTFDLVVVAVEQSSCSTRSPARRHD
jgi:hypothetical protein